MNQNRKPISLSQRIVEKQGTSSKDMSKTMIMSLLKAGRHLSRIHDRLIGQHLIETHITASETSEGLRVQIHPKMVHEGTQIDFSPRETPEVPQADTEIKEKFKVPKQIMFKNPVLKVWSVQTQKTTSESNDLFEQIGN